jgi:hypothetical protein
MDDDLFDLNKRARVEVHGWRQAVSEHNPDIDGKWTIDAGGWAPKYAAHPLVQLADSEGWGVNLRQHCVRVVRRQMGLDQPYDDLDKIMPDEGTIRYWQEKASREAAAAQWRAKVIEEHGSMAAYLSHGKGNRERPVDWASGQRPGFAFLQAVSPNNIHRLLGGMK